MAHAVPPGTGTLGTTPAAPAAKPPPDKDQSLAFQVMRLCRPSFHQYQPGASGQGDVLGDLNDVGSATALLSYTWGYRIVSVTDALERWADAAGRTYRDTYVWICCLCLNQHRMSTIKSSSELANELRPRVVAIGRILPMLEPWDAAIYLTRAWCLFELCG